MELEKRVPGRAVGHQGHKETLHGHRRNFRGTKMRNCRITDVRTAHATIRDMKEGQGENFAIVHCDRIHADSTYQVGMAPNSPYAQNPYDIQLFEH
ncbi:hypothetical protein TWF506_000895 [Arthrobotrys conoides]|uniref:Uncharacterized protein n=1 Tax=Arthrobotrys conoides TaxID=74498 RepID=A0AAN8NMH7_9PEZI